MAFEAPTRLEAFLKDWLESGEVTSVVAVVASGERTRWQGCADAFGRGVDDTTLFDIASLTKPFMATLALHLDVTGRLPLETPIGKIWNRCASALAQTTLSELLRHQSRLQAWTPLYRRCRTRRGAERLLLGGDLLGARLGTYSDLGFILWGLSAERILGESLSSLLSRDLLEPLGLEGVEALPGQRADVAPCLCDNGREVELARSQGLRVARRSGPAIGEPQDGNARFLGGLAAHAGLFANGSALVRFAQLWLSALAGGLTELPRELVSRALGGSGSYALGWARPRVRGSAGPALERGSFGHVGFTGSSLWIDPQREAVYALLAHRRSPQGDLNSQRRRFHTLAAQVVC